MQCHINGTVRLHKHALRTIATGDTFPLILGVPLIDTLAKEEVRQRQEAGRITVYHKPPRSEQALKLAHDWTQLLATYHALVWRLRATYKRGVKRKHREELQRLINLSVRAE